MVTHGLPLILTPLACVALLLYMVVSDIRSCSFVGLPTKIALAAGPCWALAQAPLWWF